MSLPFSYCFFIFLAILLFHSNGPIAEGHLNNNSSHIFFKDKFTGLLTADQIIYTTVKIPSRAAKVDITIWAAPSLLKPIALFRYDGIPTPTIHDALYTLPSVPLKVRLIDEQPTAAQLYIGIWGGELLHSYRYFAGNPAVTTVGVTAIIESCSSSLLLPPSCSIAPTLVPHYVYNDKSTPHSFVSNLLLLNTSTYFALSIPENVQQYQLHLNLQCIPQIYSYPQSEFLLIAEIYLDQPLEDENYLRRVYEVNTDHICNSDNPSSMIVDFPYPLPGQWTCKLYLKFNESVNSMLKSGRGFRVNVKSEITLIDAVFFEKSSDTNLFDYGTQPSVVIISMDIDRNVDEFSNGIINYSSSLLPFPSLQVVSNRRIVFAAPLDSHKGQLSIGGGMEVRLHLRITIPWSSQVDSSSPVSKDLFISQFRDIIQRPFQLVGRIGNIPQDYQAASSFHITESLTKLTNTSLYSANSIELYSEDAKKQLLINGGTDGVDLLLQCRYSWTVMKPTLPQLDDSFSKFFFVSLESFEAKHPDLIDVEKFKSEIGLQIEFTACPPNACLHGTCVIQRGDISTSQCLCSYPWAGERCDQLSISMTWYRIQISSLILSNLAMIPGVLFSMYQEIYLIAVGLFTAATASILYHLCDTDTYCIFGLSFGSLQILDVLFSTVMMAMVIMLYSPVSVHIHSAFSIFTFSLLVAPVAFDPTNPMNVILAITFAIIVCCMSWIMWKTRLSVTSLKKLSTLLGFRNTHPERVPQYTRVSQQSSERNINEVYPNTDSLGEEIEFEMANMEVSTDEIDFEKNNPSLLPEVHNDRQLTWEETGQLIFFARSGIVGVVFGMLGLCFFASQTRMNYWYTHSLWHVFIMYSAYYLVLGRVKLFQGLRFLLNKDLQNLDD